MEGEKFENFKSLSASQRKLDTKSDDSSDESNGMEYADLQGFRIVDISVLATVLASLRCPSCTKANVCLEEDKESKMGLASLLVLKCTAAKCSYHHSFYTSSKIKNKVNRRAVLAMRNIGVGHQGLVKFTCVMNMLPPMNENSYRDHVKALRNTAESVAKASMSKAAGEVKEFYEPAEDGLYDIGVSGDGTWRKRGFSSLELATFLAVAHFNDGSSVLTNVLKELDIIPGRHCKKACAKLESDRIRHSRRKSGEPARRRRKQLRNWRKGYSDGLEANEGPSYEAGAF